MAALAHQQIRLPYFKIRGSVLVSHNNYNNNTFTMIKSRRILRSTHSAVEKAPSVIATSPETPTAPITFSAPLSLSKSGKRIRIIPPGSKLPGLKAEELALLREKQARLIAKSASTLQGLPEGAHIRKALESTLIFAQYEAGTAVCIDASGWILTCSHCFGDTEDEYISSNKKAWLLFYTGLAIQVECRFWDSSRDLALLEVIAIETNDSKPGDIPEFKFVALHEAAPTYRMPIFCIGQPGRDDLESTSDRKTKYNLVEVSEGIFKGMVKDVDPQDNHDIGALKHDAWTYWGHSGAPLIAEADGKLIGLHSSWDDETAMRHGIPEVAIRSFLEQSLPDKSF